FPRVRESARFAGMAWRHLVFDFDAHYNVPRPARASRTCSSASASARWRIGTACGIIVTAEDAESAEEFRKVSFRAIPSGLEGLLRRSSSPKSQTQDEIFHSFRNDSFSMFLRVLCG